MTFFLKLEIKCSWHQEKKINESFDSDIINNDSQNNFLNHDSRDLLSIHPILMNQRNFNLQPTKCELQNGTQMKYPSTEVIKYDK